jgi:hypothetical protein
MTRSGAPFHGAHGEGRSAISPAASQVGAEPCARAFPAARARRNAPVISNNAVVAALMNWRAESTGNPLPLSRSATQLAENHGKSRSAKRISAALLPWNWKLAQTRARRLRVPSAAALARRLRLFALGRTRMSSSCNILNGRVFAHTDMTARDEGAVRSHCTIGPDLDIGRSQEGAAKFDFGPGAARPFE